MALSDSQLMLLEQLTYLNNKVYKGAGTQSVDNPKTVAELMSAFMDKNGNLDLSVLENSSTPVDDFTSNKQWAGILREIAKDKQLMKLEIGKSYYDEEGAKLATCYVDPMSNEAIVTFRGTTGAREWHDDVLGLYQSDTACQKEALAFIESLPYDNITVTGHSKGGNKAMYVALLSDKVKYCLSMDGQGFSKEFYEKYWAEIQKKGYLIKNYSLDDDYVHILLPPVPNSEQIYCEGFNAGGLDNHAPSSYFEFTDDENGNSHIVIQPNGSFVNKVTENPGFTYLHEFTNFITNVMSYEDRMHMAEYIGIILAVVMEGSFVTADGVVYTTENLMEFILSDKDAIATLLAYIIKYIETYDLTMEEVRGLLEGFGLGALANSIEEVLENLPFDIDGEDAFNWLISQIAGNLNDGKNDALIKWLLEKIAGDLAAQYGIDINEIWDKIEAEYTDIGDVNPDTANDNIATKTGKTRDFSIKNYNILMEAVSKFEKSKIDGVSNWNSYSSENWFSKLKVSIAIRLINAYGEHIRDINSECRERICRVFKDVETADNANTKSMMLHTTYLKEEVQQLKEISMRINPKF